MMRPLLMTTILASTLLLGCGDKTPEKTPDKTTEKTTDATSVPTGLFMQERPAEVNDLAKVKENAKVGDTVVFLARVGGRVKPFVDKQAVFVVSDPSLLSCELMGEDDHCSMPWDYCCEDGDNLRSGLATVRITGDDGRPIRTDAKGAGGLEESKFVVIEGVVNDRNDEGLFIVDASSIWVGGKPTYKEPRKGSN